MRAANEFDLIRRYFSRDSTDPCVLIGAGDDAALVAPDEPIAITTDTLVEGTHFLPTAAPERLAHRVLAVNLSDLAAMGARPRWYTLALTMPSADESWLDRFAAGLHAEADAHAIDLIGGNLARGPLTITLTMLGSVPADAALRRSGARTDDDIYVTGSLGDAAAGLELLRSGASRGAAERYLIERFERPTARVAAGLFLRGVATAAIDVSDGLLADLGHICDASGCGARIDIEALPLSPELRNTLRPADAIAAALNGGDDYELCFTAPRAQRAGLAAVGEAEVGTRLHRIGCIVAGHTVECRRSGEPVPIEPKGHLHF